MEFLEKLKGWLADPVLGKLLVAAFSTLLVIVLVRVAQRAVSRYVDDKSASYRVRKATALLGYVIALALIASTFSDRLGQLTVVLGVAGAGIAFALQEVIASVAGWAAISFGGFYKTGDRVQLGGIKGDVIDIGILRTTLAEVGQWVAGDLYNGRMVRVANSFVFKEPVVNYSGDFPFLWDEITVPIRFGSDVQQAEQLIRDVATEVCGDYEREAKQIWQDMGKRYPLEPATTEPMVTLTFDASWITFTLRYAVRFDRRRFTKHELSTRILAKIDERTDVTLGATALELFPMKPFEVRQTTSEG